MQYGSIGWSVGATLGYAQAAKEKRVIACIGDGSFQVKGNDFYKINFQTILTSRICLQFCQEHILRAIVC